MGIYPEEKYEKQRNGNVVRTYNDFSGVVTTTIYIPILTIEARDKCYCCSCFEGHHDPYCRNHGEAGERPCERHDMPGSSQDLPSVQAHRRALKEQYFAQHYGRY